MKCPAHDWWPQHSTVNQECRDNSAQKSFTDTCVATCDPGYTGTEDKPRNLQTVKGTYKCNADGRSTTGKWEGNLEPATKSKHCDGVCYLMGYHSTHPTYCSVN